MAIIQNPVIGRASGAFANAVFTTHKGQNVLKSKALNPNDAKTAAQLLQRAKFAFIVLLLRPVAAFYLLVYKKLAVKQSEFNVALSKFSKVINDTGDGLDYNKVLANNPITGDTIYTIGSEGPNAASNEGNIRFQIEPLGYDGMPPVRMTDTLNVLYYSSIDTKFYFMQIANFRAQISTIIFDFSVPGSVNDVAFMFATNVLDGYVSESVPIQGIATN